MTQDIDPAADRTLLETTFDSVLRPSFSVDELPDLEYILTEFPAGQYMTVMTSARMPLAAAIWQPGAVGDLGILSYLAVRPDLRGRGAGRRLLTQLQSRWIAAGNTLLAEVHDPDHYTTTSDERPRDRLRFYHSVGAKRLGPRWMQPQLADHTRRVNGMLLLVLTLDPQALGVPSQLLADWARRYFTEAEGADPHDSAWSSLLGDLTAESIWVPTEIDV